jgi:hypothetical protein
MAGPWGLEGQESSSVRIPTCSSLLSSSSQVATNELPGWSRVKHHRCSIRPTQPRPLFLLPRAKLLLFVGAAEAGTVPFTSGIVPSTTAPSASTKTAGAVNFVNGDSVAIKAALFGMAVLAAL